MSAARMTIIGIEKYLNTKNESITDSWNLNIDKFDSDTLLATIIQRGGTFEALYPNPEYFYLMSDYFWRRWKDPFEKWFEALNIEYSPLENYDRSENWSESTTDAGTEGVTDNSRVVVDEDITDHTTGSNSKTGTNSETLSGKDQIDHDLNRDLDTTNQVSGFNSSSYEPKDKSHTDEVITSENTDTTYGKVTTNSINETATDNINKTVSTDNITTSANSRDIDRSNEREVEHTGRIHGNIGVTTSQQMLESELKLREWNIYIHMADIFIKEMTLTVY